MTLVIFAAVILFVAILSERLLTLSVLFDLAEGQADQTRMIKEISGNLMVQLIETKKQLEKERDTIRRAYARSKSN